MSDDPRNIYWDSSCFICFLNDAPYEVERQQQCESVLMEAEKGAAIIWTSCLTVAEVIRPKVMFDCPPFPDWATRLLAAQPKEHALLCADFEKAFGELWKAFKFQTRPSRRISDEEAGKIEGMFQWPWLR